MFELNRGQQLVLGLLLAVVIVIAVYIVLTSPLLNGRFSLSTGRETGIYYAFAERYAERITDDGANLEVVTGAGSIQTLERLVNGEVDMGFVQGGTTAGFDTSNLESLGSMYYEPVWIFHRAELEDVRYLRDMEGLRVSVGVEGSGILPLATALLAENGITAENTTFANLSSTDAEAALHAGEIDVAFFVISPRSERVYNLLADENITVMSLERAAAYRSRFPYLTDLTLAQGALDLVNNVPAQDVRLLATTATLVVRRDVPDDYTLLLLPHLVELHRQPGVLESSEEFPNTRLVELPISTAASRYYQQGPSFWTRYLPPVWASVADRLIILAIPLVTLLYPFFRGVPPVYRFGIRYSIMSWYAKLRAIEMDADELSSDDLTRRIDEVDQLETEILKRTNVPNGYLDDLYGLLEHVGLVHDRLVKLQKRRTGETT